MRTFVFAKYHGLGNDFVVVDAPDAAAVSARDARRLCDRRRGVGADGVLVVLPPHDPRVASARMRVINADGSVPEMCGNGLRCVAQKLRGRSASLSSVTVETDAGPRTCTFEDDLVTVDMGVVRVGSEVSILAEGTHFLLRHADVGNPHAVTFTPAREDVVKRVGPRLAVHEAFPEGANIEFARKVGDRLEVLVWERGVGPTQACGTGACAAAAVACESGMFLHGAPVDVVLPGGVLTITHARSGKTTMRGPAEFAFEGKVDLP